MKESTKKEIKVGILIALGLIILFSAFFIVGGKEGIFSTRYALFARFDDIEGLTVGAPVRLGGVKVGNVEDISFSDIADAKAIIVEMSIKSKSFIRIREDSKAILASMGLLGDRTVDISLGSTDSEPITPGEFVLTKGGHIIKDVEEIARNAKDISHKINEGEGSMAQIINDPRLYTNLDSLLIIWSDLSRKINEGEGNLAAIINDPTLYKNFNDFLAQSTSLIESINSGEGTLGKLAQDDGLYNHTDSALVALNNTLEKINSGEGTIGQLMENAELYERLNTTLISLDSLLVDLRENPKRYVKLSLF
ncbi:MAG: MCE family protein [candidate division Zixibacteria bacterium]|nr:MCE family protein [candidate division Zixibacteria bacterium]